MTTTVAVVEPSSISRVDIEVEIPLGEIRLRIYRPHIPSSSSLSWSSATVEMDADETASLISSALDRALADEFETTGGDDNGGGGKDGGGGSGPASGASYVGVRIESL